MVAKALASLKPFHLKRSWISIPKKDSEIGAGGYGTVHRGVLQKGLFASKTTVAVKKLYTTGSQGKRVEVALDLVRELTVQSTLNHPNVLPLIGFHLSKTLEEAWLVSPHAVNGNVYDYLERVGPGMEARLELAKDTAKGLDYLHTRVPPICHGDIKAIVTGLAPYNDEPLEGRVIHQITENILPAPLDTLECPAHVRDLLAECWQTAPDDRPSMQRALASLSAGNLHQLSSTSSSEGPSTRTAILEALERELIQVIDPLRHLRIKPTRLEFPRDRSTIGGLIRELAVWAILSHENIIPLIGFHLGERLDQAWLISPFMANGSVVDYLLRVQASEQHRLDIALDTAKGLSYLHGLNPPVCHGDIKALNVLVTHQRRAVLCDFGLARTMEAMPSGLTTSTFNQGGSLPYESPELLLGTSKRSPRSDVWAWGCLLQEIFSGKSPYYWANNPGAIVKWIVQDIPPAAANDVTCPSHVRTLLSYCWRSLPDAHPGEMPAISRQLDEGYEDLRAVVLERSRLIFSEEDSIGSGAFGTVYRARLVDDTAPETVVAVKRLFAPTDRNVTNSLHSAVLLRVNRWSTFTHTNILRITGYYPVTPSPSGEILLAFPYVSSGNLATHLNQDYTQKIALANDIAQGLLYLHTRTPPVCHGRLHPNNIFVMPDGHAVLGDYDLGGIAVADPPNAPPMELKRYQSPEQVIKTSEVSIVSDIWAFGCVFLKIVTGRLPHQDISDANLVDAFHQESLPAPIEDLDCPRRAQNILGICWRWAPVARPGISEIAAILNGRLCKFEQAWSLPVNGTVQCLRFSHDSRYLVVGFSAHIGIYESENGHLFCELPVPANPLWVQMSRSGRLLAASFRMQRTEKEDASIRLWDLHTQKLIATYEGHTSETWALDISPDDKFVVTGSYDRSIRVWSTGGKDTKPLATHKTDED
ncbi:hypothetical protein FRB99_008847, partial [Tulasnella sp. 403]